MRLDLDPLDRVIVIDMFNLVTKYECQFIFAGQLIKQTFPNEYLAAGQGKSIDEIGVGNDMKPVGQLSLGLHGDASTDLVHVNVERFFFRSQ